MVQLQADGNGGTVINFTKWQPKKTKTLGMVTLLFTVFVTISGWVYNMGGRNQQVGLIAMTVQENSKRVTAVENCMYKLDERTVQIQKNIDLILNLMQKGE